MSEAESKSTVYVFYKAKHFQAFHYYYKLARDCRRRIEKIIKSNDVGDVMTEDLFIKIGIVGKFNDADLKLILEGRAEREFPENGHIWTLSPLLCFQNDLSPSLGFQFHILKEEIGCNTILITKSKCSDDKNDRENKFHQKNVHTKEQLLRIITNCLNKPLKEMLEGWLANLETEVSSKQSVGIKAEVEAIRKQMEFDDCDESAAVSVSPVVSTKSIVPEDVKNYLFSNSEVISFGIWMDLSFKVFVKNATDEKTLMDEITNINQTFIEKYHLEIEKRKIVMKQTLKQGDSIQAKSNNDEYCEGTLGGFVTKVDDKTKIYALTCNHLFPEQNQLAYIEDNQNFKEIGFCVYTTRDKSCDFAAIEIKEAFVNECDIALRRDDKKKSNAKVNTKGLENVGIVHKIGGATDVTTGIVLSPEYYDKVTDDSNRGYIFLVKGTDGQFSEQGDSGSLVFCRPRSVQHTHIDILGIVYGNNLILNDGNDENDERTKRSPSEGAVKTKADAENADNGQYPENISCCYRIDTALELFRKNYSKTFEVKFQDELPLTSSSQSSKSDDSNEEHSE